MRILPGEDVDSRRLSDLSSPSIIFSPCWIVVSTLITIFPLHIPAWESLTLNLSRGRTIPTNATLYLPIRKHYMAPNKAKKKNVHDDALRLALSDDVIEVRINVDWVIVP